VAETTAMYAEQTLTRRTCFVCPQNITREELIRSVVSREIVSAEDALLEADVRSVSERCGCI
jgi:predicted RNA-binding protein YlxR (DUF448 family)